MKHAVLVKGMWIGVAIYGMVFIPSFVLAAQETIQEQEGEACAIDPRRTVGVDQHRGAMAEAQEYHQKMLGQGERIQQREQEPPAEPVAEEPRHTLPPQFPGGSNKMEQYYLGRHYKNALFPGRLVCLRCDTMPTPENVEVCPREGHRHALAMEGDTMVHPLLFTSEDLFTKVNAQDWHHKKVRVWGRYYADTGFIVVGDIQAVEE